MVGSGEYQCLYMNLKKCLNDLSLNYIWWGKVHIFVIKSLSICQGFGDYELEGRQRGWGLHRDQTTYLPATSVNQIRMCPWTGLGH